jgi:hypothetical protein
MRYYLNEVPGAGGEARWTALARKIVAGAIAVAMLAVIVVLFIFFFSVITAIVGAVILVGLLALLINSFHRPRPLS